MICLRSWPDARINRQASVPRDAFPPTPPGPEGSNGNGLLRVQWVSGAWLKNQTFDSRAPGLARLKILEPAHIAVV